MSRQGMQSPTFRLPSATFQNRSRTQPHVFFFFLSTRPPPSSPLFPTPPLSRFGVAGAAGAPADPGRLGDRAGRRPAAPARRLIEDGQERHLVDPLLLPSPLLLAQDELLHLP